MRLPSSLVETDIDNGSPIVRCQSMKGHRGNASENPNKHSSPQYPSPGTTFDMMWNPVSKWIGLRHPFNLDTGFRFIWNPESKWNASQLPIYLDAGFHVISILASVQFGNRRLNNLEADLQIIWTQDFKTFESGAQFNLDAGVQNFSIIVTGVREKVESRRPTHVGISSGAT